MSKMDMPTPQAGIDKGKQAFKDNTFRRMMDNSSHAATVAGKKKKHPMQRKYLGHVIQGAKGIAAHKEGKK